MIRFLQPYVLVIAGLPGVILGGMYTNRTQPRFILGSIVSAIGQSYVNLAFVALTVAYAGAAVQRDDVIGFFVWPVAFLVVFIPTYSVSTGVSIGNLKAKEDNPVLSAQIGALHITLLATIVSFFLFIFVPVSMLPWAYVPYVSTAMNGEWTDKDVESLVHFKKSMEKVENLEVLNRTAASGGVIANALLINQMCSEAESGLEQAKLVDPKVLNRIHPELANQFTTKYVEGLKLLNEICLNPLEAGRIENTKTANRLLNEYIKWQVGAEFKLPKSVQKRAKKMMESDSDIGESKATDN